MRILRMLRALFVDEAGGLGITRASLQSAICDATGDDSADAAVKVQRLINQRGSSFCNLTNWPFTRDDIKRILTEIRDEVIEENPQQVEAIPERIYVETEQPVSWTKRLFRRKK